MVGISSHLGGPAVLDGDQHRTSVRTIVGAGASHDPKFIGDTHQSLPSSTVAVTRPYQSSNSRAAGAHPPTPSAMFGGCPSAEPRAWVREHPHLWLACRHVSPLPRVLQCRRSRHQGRRSCTLPPGTSFTDVSARPDHSSRQVVARCTTYVPFGARSPWGRCDVRSRDSVRVPAVSESAALPGLRDAVRAEVALAIVSAVGDAAASRCRLSGVSGTPPRIEEPINTTPGLPSSSIGVAVGRPDPRQSETRMADGRRSLSLARRAPHRLRSDGAFARRSGWRACPSPIWPGRGFRHRSS